MQKTKILLLALISLSSINAFSKTCDIQERQYIPGIDYAFNTNFGVMKQVNLSNWIECFYLAAAISRKITFTSEFEGKVKVVRSNYDQSRTETYEGKMTTVHYLHWSFDDSYLFSDAEGSVSAYTLPALQNSALKGDQLFYSNGGKFNINEDRHQW